MYKIINYHILFCTKHKIEHKNHRLFVVKKERKKKE
jgi:hypothetical protein